MTDGHSEQGSFFVVDGEKDVPKVMQTVTTEGKDVPKVLVKVMRPAGNFRLWVVDSPSYANVHAAVLSTHETTSRITYEDDDGDRCVLTEHTFADCRMFAKRSGRFRLWADDAEPHAGVVGDAMKGKGKGKGFGGLAQMIQYGMAMAQAQQNDPNGPNVPAYNPWQGPTGGQAWGGSGNWGGK